MIKLIDFVQIAPNPNLVKLSKKEKINLIDSSVNPSSSKGLIITYDLSHSGRRINNRIYSIAGQRDGVKSLLQPYAKPILQHHDMGRDPIGRFINGQYEDLSGEAMRFFDSLSSFNKFRFEMESDDPERMYKALKKANLLNNKDWPGMGRMRATARITDKEAIEKFLDGRYITFSAGSTTNRHVCSICSSDWASGDYCEHRHGKIYDKEVCVFFTGDFTVLEGSVVNSPADDLSQIHSMEFLSDSIAFDTKKEIELDDSFMYLSDSLISFNEEVPMLNDKAPVEDEKDAAETVCEDESSSEENNVLSDDILEQIFSFVLSKMKEIQNDEKETREKEPEGSIEVLEAKDTQTNETEECVRSDGAEVQRVQADLQEKEEVTEVDLVDGESVVEDAELDWYLLDCALNIELGDATLSTETRNKLPDSAFCGPERSFPIPDCAHVTAARRLIGRSKLSDAQKEKVMSCVNKKAESMSCDVDSNKDSSIELKLKELTQKFEQQIEDLKEKLKSLVSSDSVEKKVAVEKVVETTDSLKPVENPSVSSADESSPIDLVKNDSLGNYEQQIVTMYNKILNDSGEIAAEDFFSTKARYLPKGFHPKKYLF